jgi:hypothetical protein
MKLTAISLVTNGQIRSIREASQNHLVMVDISEDRGTAVTATEVRTPINRVRLPGRVTLATSKQVPAVRFCSVNVPAQQKKFATILNWRAKFWVWRS